MPDWNLTLSLVSLLTGSALSVFSIALSAYFYTQAKNSESDLRTTLGEIRQQTNSLERLGGKMLDRLTKAVTEGRPEHEHRQMVLVLEAVRTGLTVHTAGAGPQTQQPTATPETRAAMLQLVSATQLYAAVANLSFQGYLPDSIADVDPALRSWLDITNSDVVAFDAWLGQPSDDWPDAARRNREVQLSLRANVRDTLSAYQARVSTAPSANPE